MIGPDGEENLENRHLRQMRVMLSPLLSKYKPHERQWVLTELERESIHLAYNADGTFGQIGTYGQILSIIDGLEYYRGKIKDSRFQQIMKPIVSPANPKDLIQITLQQIKTGQQQYDAKYGSVSRREAKKILKRSYAQKLVDEPDLKVIKIERTDDTDGAAKTLTQYAMNTRWCVTDLKIGEYYLKRGPIYYIEYKGAKYLCHIESTQLMNEIDIPFSVNLELYYRLVKHIKEIGLFLNNHGLQEYIDSTKYNPERACSRAINDIKGRWPEAEPTIMKDPVWAYEYVKQIIMGRWLEAEPYMMRDSMIAYSYAKKFINGRWPEAEPIIMKNPEFACYYARDVIKGRWPEAESIMIAMNQNQYGRALEYCLYLYARDVINDRWPEAEPIIMQNPAFTYQYTMNVIKGRWPEAEPIMIQDQYYACRYAINVINGRWPEAEQYIMQNRTIWNEYTRHFDDDDDDDSGSGSGGITMFSEWRGLETMDVSIFRNQK